MFCYQHEHNFDVETSVAITNSVKRLKIIQKIRKCSAVCTNALLLGWWLLPDRIIQFEACIHGQLTDSQLLRRGCWGGGTAISSSRTHAHTNAHTRYLFF